MSNQEEVEVLVVWHGHLVEAWKSALPPLIQSFADVASLGKEEALSAEKADERCREMRGAMTLHASTLVSQRSAISWLFLLRTVRLDMIAELIGEDPDGDGEISRGVARIAENVAGVADGQGVDATFDADSARNVAELLATSWLIERSEQLLRSVTKGMHLFVGPQAMPYSTGPRDLRTAIMEYDFRQRWQSIERWEDDLSNMTDYVVDGVPAVLMVYRVRDHIAMVPTWLGPYAEGLHQEMQGQFIPKVWTGRNPWNKGLAGSALASVREPLRIAGLILLSHTLLRYVFETSLDAGRTLPVRGIIKLGGNDLERLLNQTLGLEEALAWMHANGIEMNADAIIAHVAASYQASANGRPGPVLLRDNDAWIIDVWALTWHISLECRIDFTKGGAEVNAEAFAFEVLVQSLIDASPLIPSDRLRALRGRPLRSNGRTLTDVDAIAMDGNQLLLISCKRFGIDIDYLSGSFRSVRSLTERANKAVEDWNQLIKFFRENPTGDNYDFAGFSIDGLVVVPELVFSTDVRARDILDLRGGPLGFTKLESIDQFASMLEMVSQEAP